MLFGLVVGVLEEGKGEKKIKGGKRGVGLFLLDLGLDLD